MRTLSSPYCAGSFGHTRLFWPQKPRSPLAGHCARHGSLQSFRFARRLFSTATALPLSVIKNAGLDPKCPPGRGPSRSGNAGNSSYDTGAPPFLLSSELRDGASDSEVGTACSSPATHGLDLLANRVRNLEDAPFLPAKSGNNAEQQRPQPPATGQSIALLARVLAAPRHRNIGSNRPPVLGG